MDPAKSTNRGPRQRLVTLVVVLGFLVSIAGGILGYILLTKPPPPEPCTTAALRASTGPKNLVSFSLPSTDRGNATITIVRASFCPPPSEYRFRLGFNQTAGGAGEFAPSGNHSATLISNVSFHVSWIDVDRQGLVNVGDTFLISGDGKPPPPRSDFAFYLLLTDMSSVATATWVTP
jgi:hypothetical protein